MRIAVPYENGNIFQHFGRSEAFKFYDVADGAVTAAAVVSTNGSGHGALAGFLVANHADVVICGGIGGGAQSALTEAGIRFYGGVSGSADAAGYDLYACPADGQCVTIAPHVTAMIGTGLALAIPAGYFGGVFARSGLASKQGLRPANCVGVIDADYRGECTVALHNDTDEVRTVAPGDRIAQLVILPFLAAEFAEADALDETDRGAGGFGSTGR